MPRMKRVYRHVDDLEEGHNGMWRTASGDEGEAFIRAARDLMRDPEAFLAAMLKAVSHWPNSCEHNLTSLNMNRRAWLGHAGCCVALGSPEAMTRLGWHRLSLEQQTEANRVADLAIEAWRIGYEARNA